MLHGALRGPFARSRGLAGGAFEASSWAAAVVANGGTVSAGRLAIVASFVTAEKASGGWALTDDYWGLWGESAIQSRTSLKQRRLATEVAVPLWTIDRGYTFNGTTQYVDTGFVASTHGVVMTGTNQRIAVYERLNVAGVSFSAGGLTASAGLNICARDTNYMFGVGNSSPSNLTYILPANDSRGFTAQSLNGTTLAGAKGYKNGIELVPTSSGVTFTSTLIATSIFIGANSSTGIANFFRATSIGMVVVGASLSGAQELAQYNNVQAWATAIGANV